MEAFKNHQTEAGAIIDALGAARAPLHVSTMPGISTYLCQKPDGSAEVISIRLADTARGMSVTNLGDMLCLCMGEDGKLPAMIDRPIIWVSSTEIMAAPADPLDRSRITLALVPADWHAEMQKVVGSWQPHATIAEFAKSYLPDLYDAIGSLSFSDETKGAFSVGGLARSGNAEARFVVMRGDSKVVIPDRYKLSRPRWVGFDAPIALEFALSARVAEGQLMMRLSLVNPVEAIREATNRLAAEVALGVQAFRTKIAVICGSWSPRDTPGGLVK